MKTAVEPVSGAPSRPAVIVTETTAVNQIAIARARVSEFNILVPPSQGLQQVSR
jgi:hypothetical protein